MTTIKPTLFKACPLHPEEPIIRASLDIKSSKLLYCQECLEGLDNSIQAGLFKFSHVGEKLFEQLSKKYEEYQQSLPNTSPKEYRDKIESFISQQKTKADQEFVKIQTELLELMAASKNEVYKTLDKIKINLLTDCDVSMEKVNNFPDPGLYEGKDVTKDEIYKEIEGNEDSVQEIEKKIRVRLETMKRLDEIREETLMSLSRHEKAKLLETLPLMNPKGSDFYKNSLKGLDTYFQALIFEREESNKQEEKASIIPSGQNNLLEVLIQSVKACQASLEKTKDRVAGFIEGMVGQYYSDPINDGKAVTESTNMNSNRNVYYDEPDHVSSSSEEKLYDDGYFDYEEEF